MQVRCPQCGAVAPVEPGRMPVCPGCGFSGQPVYASDAAPVQPAEFMAEPLPTTDASAPSTRRRRVSAGMVVFMVILVLLLGGAIALAVGYERGWIEWSPYP